MDPPRFLFAAQFWNQEIESARSLDTVARTLPNEPAPLGIRQPTKLSRPQQLLLLQKVLACPATPSFCAEVEEEGGVVLDRVLAYTGGRDWWATLTGRLRLQRLWQKPQGDAEDEDDNLEKFVKRPFKALRDFSNYGLAVKARSTIDDITTLRGNLEVESLEDLKRGSNRGGDSGNRNLPLRGRVTCRRQLKAHHVTLEGALNDRCLDQQSNYWDVPSSLSLDLASDGPQSGLRYRVGVHHIASPQPGSGYGPFDVLPPSSAYGTRAQAAVALENTVTLWRADPARRRRGASYNPIAARPRLVVSGGVGTLVTTENVWAYLSDDKSSVPKSFPVSTALFGSFGIHGQVGEFKRAVFDYTSLALRLDVGPSSVREAATAESATEAGVAGSVARGSSGRTVPALTISAQQQVIGPLRARVDTRLSMTQAGTGFQPGKTLETVYSLDCPVGAMGTGRLVCWYSPTRREGMAEIRLFEKD
ncbi:Protein Involved in Lipid Transport [Klebsormidium nitens]|uniref:Protein Involved in Lipid Transport n=1 Tax=Klebsormidium nitens TaxID=105231 RepID=A0A1Y1HTY0_KLENI|nr:Protein Involved in Lipid Transport [Klebsormidium nitens]|eukprot:GAQ82084.1 Protein Involved in Lipid Transport [Klebsormidium nitens]